MSNPRATADALRLSLGITGDRYHLSTNARGLITPNGNQGPYVGSAGELRHSTKRSVGIGQSIKDNYLGLATTDQLLALLATGAAFAGTTAALHHLYMPQGTILAVFPLGAGQTLAPAIVATGLDIGGDQTSTEGYEIASHCFGAQGRPFIIGRDPTFYMQATVLITDASGVNPMLIGFRRAGAVNGTLKSYADYAGIGCDTAANPMLLKTITEKNGAGDTSTSTTQTLADARALTVRVTVSDAGVVTFAHDAGTLGTLAAPTVTQAFTFDTGDPVIPFIHFLNAADLCDAFVIESLEVGYVGN
jgi:hypothetical protein